MKNLLFWSFVLLGGGSSAVAEEFSFVVENDDLSRALTTALLAYDDTSFAIDQLDGKIVVYNDDGEVAIACDPEGRTSCSFDAAALDMAGLLRSRAHQAVFDALHAAFDKREELEHMTKLSLRGNENRTFISLRGSSSDFGDGLHQGIDCNATPNSRGIGFDFADCDFDISKRIVGDEAEELYSRLLEDSDISDSLRSYEDNARLQRAEVAIVRVLDFISYGWQEVVIKFVASEEIEPGDGDYAEITINVFLSAVNEDTLLIESSRTNFSRFSSFRAGRQ